MNGMQHTGLIVGSALLALGNIACQGEIPDRVPASSEHGTATSSFEHGTASSSLENGLIVTEVRDGDDTLVSSAEWQVEAGEGRIETGQQSLVAKLPPGIELTLGLANQITYNAWADQWLPESADEVAYDDGVECNPCQGGPAACCFCVDGQQCCTTEWCRTEAGNYEPRMNCGGSCSPPPPPPSCSDGCGGCGCCDNSCCI